MTTLRVFPADAFRARVPAPAAEPLVSMALVVGALADGTSRLRLGARAQSATSLERSLTELGARVDHADDGFVIAGTGGRWQPPASGRVDVNSPTALALLSGALSGQGFAVRIGAGREHVERPWLRAAGSLEHAAARSAQLLRARGARIEGTFDPNDPTRLELPLTIEPAALSELSVELPFGDVIGKVSALSSGLFAAGTTRLHERLVTDDRWERLLVAAGVTIGAAGGMLELEPPERPLTAFDTALPGDLDLGLYLLAGGVLTGREAHDPDVVFGVRAVGTTPARGGGLEVLRDAGVAVEHVVRGEALGATFGDLWATATPYRGLDVGGERALRSAGALGALVALGVGAESPSRFADLMLADRARGQRFLALLEAFGHDGELTEGVLRVAPAKGGRWRGTRFDAGGDPELAMTAVVLALGAHEPSEVANADAIAAVFPRFVACLRGLGARIDVLARDAPTRAATR